MIFFDVRRFLGNETWLKRMIFAEPMETAFTPAQLRERRWLSIAFYRGWPGVEQVVLQRRPATNEEVKEQMSQIEAILTSLALEHAHDLESSGTQPSAVDLRCLLALRHSESGQHHEDDTYRGKPMALWMAELSTGERTTAEAEPENPEHDTVRKPDASVKETSAMEPRRLRARFATGWSAPREGGKKRDTDFYEFPINASGKVSKFTPAGVQTTFASSRFETVLEIPRSLPDGSHYSPDWRSQAAESYVGAILASADAPATLAEIQRTEKDPYVRQWVRFRHTGRCVAQGRFRYAAECAARNDATGASSLIKTLLIADRTYEEIAEELGTTRENIVAFAMIYFDVRRFLGNETWLQRMIFAEPMGSAFTPTQLRERRWLSLAFHRGWPGVQQVVLQRRLATNEEVQEQMLQIKAILTSLALEHAHDLESSGTQPSAVDLRCFLALRHSESGQHREDERYGHKARVAWLRKLLDVAKKAAEAEPENPQYEGLRNLFASIEETSTVAPRRLRTRFATD
jgi:hypothetical protein